MRSRLALLREVKPPLNVNSLFGEIPTRGLSGLVRHSMVETSPVERSKVQKFPSPLSRGDGNYYCKVKCRGVQLSSEKNSLTKNSRYSLIVVAGTIE